ncbi:hypothetical protein FOZ63_017951, partial [Perkinsus olseni]
LPSVDANVDVLKEGRVRLIFHRARGLASSSPSAVANGVVLAKLLRSSDGAVVYSCSTLRCAIDNWDGSCDINEELVLPIPQGRQAEELIVQMSLMVSYLRKVVPVGSLSGPDERVFEGAP